MPVKPQNRNKEESVIDSKQKIDVAMLNKVMNKTPNLKGKTAKS